MKRGRPAVDSAIRFWSKVTKTDQCWNWTDALTSEGYGRLKVSNLHILAHRFSWDLHGLGPIEGTELDHRCLNRRCVNPDHLRTATRKQQNENKAGAYRNNPVGIRGVTRTRNGRPFKALVVHNHTHYYLGRFDTSEEAEHAVIAKRLELYTHNEVDRLMGPATA